MRTQLGHIREQRQMEPETTPREVFEDLAIVSVGADVQALIDRVVELLEQTSMQGWFSRWLIVRRGSKQI